LTYLGVGALDYKLGLGVLSAQIVKLLDGALGEDDAQGGDGGNSLLGCGARLNQLNTF
jgi:hypothetical protein